MFHGSALLLRHASREFNKTHRVLNVNTGFMALRNHARTQWLWQRFQEECAHNYTQWQVGHHPSQNPSHFSCSFNAETEHEVLRSLLSESWPWVQLHTIIRAESVVLGPGVLERLCAAAHGPLGAHRAQV